MMVDIEIDHSVFRTCEVKPGKKSPYVNVLTALTFGCCLFILPALILCFVFSKITKKIWIAVLSIYFPRLKFVEPDSVRTLLDTHRNQGIINVLMIVKGNYDLTVVKQTLQDHIVEKRNKKGELLFPILKLKLISCWGNYAWVNTSDFEIDNHVIVGSPKYRGRPLNEQNLQEYVSGITSKFLLSTQPPWHVTIIPNISATELTYGILVRVHHLILEEGSLGIGDFMCLKPESEQFNNLNDSFEKEEYDNTSPLSSLVKPSEAVSTLRNRLSDSISNHWNEFISVFDPTTSSELLKKPPGLFDCLAIALICLTSAYKDTRAYMEHSGRSVRLFSYALRAFNYERKKRKLTLSTIILSLVITFNPVSLIINFIKMFIWINIKIYFKLPVHLYHECSTIKSYITKNVCTYPNTITGLLCDYLPIVCKAVREMWQVVSTVYSAPFTIIKEMFFNNENFEEHHLQKTSSCGRKVVAWSEPISRKYINEIATNEGVTETEVLLTMTAACIKDYFHHCHLLVPYNMATVTKTISYDRLLCTHDQKYDNEKHRGMVFLTLPMNKICLGKCHDDVHCVSKEVQRVKAVQAAVYILTSCQDYLTELFPSVYLRIFLNYITRKFSISILEINEGKNNIFGANRTTIWNDTVTSIFYWRPPQSNTGMSLTIQRYGNNVRLNVMTDSLLAPQHHVPARHWGRAARKLHGNSADNHSAGVSSNQSQAQYHERSHRRTLHAEEDRQASSSSSDRNDSVELKELTESQETVTNSSIDSTDGSNSSENLSVSPATFTYDYLLNSEYKLDDFIRDVQFEDDEECSSKTIKG